MILTDPLDTLNDPARLAELDATGLMDSGPEESYDRITRLAAEFLQAPSEMSHDPWREPGAGTLGISL